MSEQATAPSAAPAPPLRTIPETAERLRVSREYVYQLIRRGELACIDLPLRKGAKWAGKRVEQSEIDAFIARNRVQA